MLHVLQSQFFYILFINVSNSHFFVSTKRKYTCFPGSINGITLLKGKTNVSVSINKSKLQVLILYHLLCIIRVSTGILYLYLCFERHGCFGKVYMKLYMSKSTCIHLYLVLCIHFKGYTTMGYAFIMMFIYIIIYFYFVALYLSGSNHRILIRLST